MENRVGAEYEISGEYTCKITVSLAGEDGDIVVEYDAIPQPDANGIFAVEGRRRVVVPIATEHDLEHAEILCVGEQLYHLISERLGEAPVDLPWDESLARSWLPLDRWIADFMLAREDDAPLFSDSVSLKRMPYLERARAQLLDETNWLSERTHLRRLIIPTAERVIAPAHFGRACPYETPEGPNIGKILSIAIGAEIRDGTLIIVDDRPEAALGVSATMVPLLEHNEANRQLMGCNMMRQWLVPTKTEEAIVQTGAEPDEPGFWNGVNLLTAFVAWGVDTFKDGILISESAAKRFKFELPIEPGDKISNRHGTKGVISRILPDDQMPHLADGTPVELAFSFLGCHTRNNFGQIREAVLSRIARSRGDGTLFVPPFHAPREKEIRQRLATAGLPESGMERLTLGRHGKPLARLSTVGWVYWGLTLHVARNKVVATASTEANAADIKVPFNHPRWFMGQAQGIMEYCALRDAKAFENIRETYNTRAVARVDGDTLSERVASGQVEQACSPSPTFEMLARRLAVGGIRIELKDEQLSFSFASTNNPTLELAQPIPHPWIPERELKEVGLFEEAPLWAEMAKANDKAKRLVESGAPESLSHRAVDQLEARVGDFFRSLLVPRDMRFYVRKATSPAHQSVNRVLFSGRAVMAPGVGLRIDQVGIPDDMAWVLFGPLVIREMGRRDDVEARSERAAKVLDSIMARSWVIINRAPSLWPTNEMAFRPMRHPSRTIGVHPAACLPMNGDFDGDQVSAFLPITEAGQREAGERLSAAGHLRRDPELLPHFIPTHEPMWGLASLSLTADGKKEISDLAGIEVATPDGFVTHQAVTDALRKVMERDGVAAMLQSLDHLIDRGLQVATESGASISPFIGESLDRPREPADDDPEAWNALSENCADRIVARTDYDDSDMGPQVLAVKCGARGSADFLVSLFGSRGTVENAAGETVTIRHNFVTGLEADEAFAKVAGARRGMAQVSVGQVLPSSAPHLCSGLQSLPAKPFVRMGRWTKGYGALSRAMRSERPGMILARAAAVGETDPLTDIDSRLFVGLGV